MRKSIRDARAQLRQFGSELGGLIAARKSSTYVDPVTGKTPAELRAGHDKVLRDRREAELKAARDTAATAEDTARAQRDLDDFYTEESIANAERDAEAAGANAEKSVDNLVAQFNRGTISADQFRTELSNLIGAPLGDVIGGAFGDAFSAALSNVTAQVDALNVGRFGGERRVGDSGVVNPQDVADEEGAAAAAARRYPKGANLGPWQDKASRDRAFAALDDDVKARSGKTRTGEKGNYRYGIKVKPLADGGILRRAILAGEAGREAVIPLDASTGRRALARAMSDAGAGSTGGTTIVVNVAGNEFSAEEFARKVAPELRRQIALTGSY